MYVLATCITWNRPELLGRSIHCFLQQTCSNGRLFILDDAGQYHTQEHENWTLFSTPDRYPSMGAKRNALLTLALRQYPEIEGLMLWDDDDCFFPHTIQSVSNALDRGLWAQPRLALEMELLKPGLRQVTTCHRRKPPVQSGTSVGYGGSWAWQLGLFRQAGGFADTNHSEDVKLAKLCQQQAGDSIDSSPDGPWYYYNRLNNAISAEGKEFYALRGRQEVKFVGDPPIGWNGQNILDLPIRPGIFPRPW